MAPGIKGAKRIVEENQQSVLGLHLIECNNVIS